MEIQLLPFTSTSSSSVPSLKFVLQEQTALKAIGRSPVDREMKAALPGTPSPLATALDLVRCHESGDWREYQDIQKALGLTEHDASMIYVESVRWADKATRAGGA